MLNFEIHNAIVIVQKGDQIITQITCNTCNQAEKLAKELTNDRIKRVI